MANIFTKQRRPVIELIGQLLLLASLVSAVTRTLGIIPTLPYGFEVAAALPVGLLVLFTLINTRAFNHILLSLALVAATVASVFTPADLSLADANMWIANAVFLTFLMILFSANRRKKDDISPSHLNGAGLISATAMLFAIWIFPRIEDDILYHGSYGMLLLLTVVLSVISHFQARLIVLGCVAFGASNALMLALLVTNAPDFFPLLIGILGYVGHILITLGIMLTPERTTGFGKYRFD